MTAQKFFAWSWGWLAWDYDCTLVYLTLEDETTWEKVGLGFYWRVK